MSHRVIVDRDTVNDDFVVIRKVYKTHGAEVAADELVVEYETSKTAVESRAPHAGVVSIALEVGQEVAIGGLLFEVRDPTHVAQPTSAPEAQVAQPESNGGADEQRYSREALRVARELGVDIQSVQGNGWITAADVRRHAGGAVKPASAPAPRVTDTTQSPPRVGTPYKSEKLSPRKRAEVRALTAASVEATGSTIGVPVMTGGERMAPPPAIFAESIADLVIFEGARLLRSYPHLNGFCLDEARVALYEEINFGVSFDGGANLKVLTLRGADSKTLPQIQTEFTALLDVYESGKPIEEAMLTGATITISDLSNSRAQFMLPLINGLQSTIIGITRAGHGFTLFATFDHRLSEGLAVTRFLEELAARVQSHFISRTGVSDAHCMSCAKGIAEEVALGRLGMIRIVLADGGDGLVCWNCFQGF